jgi:hypothetical protein
MFTVYNLISCFAILLAISLAIIFFDILSKRSKVNPIIESKEVCKK